MSGLSFLCSQLVFQYVQTFRAIQHPAPVTHKPYLALFTQNICEFLDLAIFRRVALWIAAEILIQVAKPSWFVTWKICALTGVRDIAPIRLNPITPIHVFTFHQFSLLMLNLLTVPSRLIQ